MADIRKLPEQSERVETGAIQFGDNDWPGTFIRGDDSFAFRLALEGLLSNPSDPIYRMNAQSLIQLLNESNIGLTRL